MLEKIGREVVKKSVCQKHNRKKKKKKRIPAFRIAFVKCMWDKLFGAKSTFCS